MVKKESRLIFHRLWEKRRSQELVPCEGIEGGERSDLFVIVKGGKGTFYENKGVNGNGSEAEEAENSRTAGDDCL